MSAAPTLHPAGGLRGDPLAGRLLVAYLVSLLLHGLLLVLVTGGWLAGSSRPEKPPVYYVDLVHKPVLNPQAGRPEPRVAPAPPKPAPAAKSPSVPPPAKPATKPMPAAKPAPKSDERHVQKALDDLRAERALQERLAALRQAQAVPADLPVGLPDARGNEAGVTSLVYVQATIQQNWALSPYLLADRKRMADLEAWVRITYGKNGRLEGFRFEKESGDVQFDESIKRALVKSQQLPNALPVRLEDLRVIFNLKELTALAEARR